MEKKVTEEAVWAAASWLFFSTLYTIILTLHRKAASELLMW